MDALRSLLFVPADNPRKLAKARTLRPDAFILDLEDGVAIDKKLEARATLTHNLESFKGLASKIFVRVNSIGAKFFEGDISSAVDPVVDGIFLPKCEDETDVNRVDSEITRTEAQKRMAPGKTKLLLILETPRGVVRAYEIGRSSKRVAALAFGPEDYCAEMGIRRTRSGAEISIPRMLVSQAAHAARIAALDGVFSDFHDEEGLIEDTRRGKEMGYTGKAVIHPSQILPVHRTFAPAEDDVAWAEEVIEAYREAGKKGSGLAVVRGRMVDEPIVGQARRILRQRGADNNGK